MPEPIRNGSKEVAWENRNNSTLIVSPTVAQDLRKHEADGKLCPYFWTEQPLK